MIPEDTGASNDSSAHGLLYHYTDQKGLLGIIGERKVNIWATNARYLNDSSEFKHGLQILRRNLDKWTTDISSTIADATPNYWSDTGTTILRAAITEALDKVDGISVFVTSFFSSDGDYLHVSAEDAGDVLSQWRAYSRGSGGFSIGFDKGLMSDHVALHTGDPVRPMTGSECIYDREIQERYIRSRITEIGLILKVHFEPLIDQFATETLPTLLDSFKIANDAELLSEDRKEKLTKEFAKRITSAVEETREAVKASFSSAMISHFAKIIVPPVFMKHQAFSGEREWRIAQLHSSVTNEVKFRPGKSSLIPYVEIPFPLYGNDGNSLIRRIVVGPTPEIQDAIAAVRMFLESRGLQIKGPGRPQGIEIAGTKIPYRDW